MILERLSENSEGPSESTSRWALTLSYDGSRFFGWQKQADGVVFGSGGFGIGIESNCR